LKLDSSFLDDAFESVSDASTAGSLTSISGDTVTTAKGSGSQAAGVKSLLIGNNAFAFCCRVVEQFIMINYYDEAGLEAENVRLPSRDRFNAS